MASTTAVATRTPGIITMPGAKGFLPPGSSREACIQHHRMLKATITALRAHLGSYDPETISDTEMANCAQEAGVLPPGSGATRALIRGLMRHFASVGTGPYGDNTTADGTATVQSYGYWRVAYTDDLGRAAKTGPLVTPREVELKLEHFHSRRARPYTGITVQWTAVVETTTTIDPATL